MPQRDQGSRGRGGHQAALGQRERWIRQARPHQPGQRARVCQGAQEQGAQGGRAHAQCGCHGSSGAPAHGGRVRAAVWHEPPGPLCAHEGTLGPRDEVARAPHRHRLERGAPVREDGLRRPQRREGLWAVEGVRAVQAEQRPLCQGARPPHEGGGPRQRSVRLIAPRWCADGAGKVPRRARGPHCRAGRAAHLLYQEPLRGRPDADLPVRVPEHHAFAIGAVLRQLPARQGLQPRRVGGGRGEVVGRVRGAHGRQVQRVNDGLDSRAPVRPASQNKGSRRPPRRASCAPGTGVIGQGAAGGAAGKGRRRCIM
mmetsp:Transcript_20293/g.68891  ORF Transcript_20293/g.68891 Transcript_20293/m.68891 type:complete len:312 (-) Transcript_20293:825-1760(-)